MLRRRFKKRRHSLDSSQVADLQITSLADILVIVLVFLMKTISFNVGSVENVRIPATLSLPVAQESGTTREGLKVSIAQSKIELSNGVSEVLENFRFYNWDLKDSRETKAKISKSFYAALSKYKSENGRDKESTLWILADKNVPFPTLQTVLGSAALLGFTDIKLAVSQGAP